MQIVLLSSRGSIYGGQVLDAAKNEGLEIAGVIVEYQPSRGGWRRIRYYIRKYGLMSVLARAVELGTARMVRPAPDAGKTVERVASRVGVPCYCVDHMNSAEALAAIKQFHPEMGLLGGTRMLKEPCIQQFPRGILNAHLGLLPKYRGNYGNRWAQLEGDPCGLSVYLLDEGLDTGPILVTQVEDPIPGEGPVQSDDRLTKLGARLLVRTAKAYLTGSLTPRLQLPHEGTKHPFMSAKNLLRLHWKLHRKRANALGASVQDRY